MSTVKATHSLPGIQMLKENPFLFFSIKKINFNWDQCNEPLSIHYVSDSGQMICLCLLFVIFKMVIVIAPMSQGYWKIKRMNSWKELKGVSDTHQCHHCCLTFIKSLLLCVRRSTSGSSSDRSRSSSKRSNSIEAWGAAPAVVVIVVILLVTLSSGGSKALCPNYSQSCPWPRRVGQTVHGIFP